MRGGATVIDEQRYTLTLPTDLYEQVRALAESRGMSIREAMRQCIQIGLFAGRKDTDLLVREVRPDGRERETLLKIW